MQTRRDALKRSFAVASLLMGAGMLPELSHTGSPSSRRPARTRAA